MPKIEKDLMTIVPTNYNTGVKKKQVSRPSFKALRTMEHSIEKERNRKGVDFVSGEVLDNEVGFAKRIKVKNAPKYAHISIVNKVTGQYYNQPVALRQDYNVSLNNDGLSVLNYIPKVNHKKLNKDIKLFGLSSYECVVTDIDKTDNFLQYVFEDLIAYGNDTNEKRYNRNINFKNIYGNAFNKIEFDFTNLIKGKFDLAEKIVQNEGLLVRYFKQENVSIKYGSDLTKPITISVGNEKETFSALEIFNNNSLSRFCCMIRSYEVVRPVLNISSITPTQPQVNSEKEFVGKIFIILDKTLGKVKFVPSNKFTNLEEYVKHHGSQELKRCFNRGDEFEVLEYNVHGKSNFKEVAYKSAYAKAFRIIRLEDDHNTRTILMDLFKDYKDLLLNSYDTSLDVRADIEVHLNQVYGEFHKQVKRQSTPNNDESVSSVINFILKTFSPNSIKYGQAVTGLNRSISMNKVFLNKVGAESVIKAFSRFDIRLSAEDKRRTHLTEVQGLVMKKAFPNYASINKIFHGCSKRAPLKREVSVVDEADITGLLGKDKLPTTVNGLGSDAQNVNIENMIVDNSRCEYF